MPVKVRFYRQRMCDWTPFSSVDDEDCAIDSLFVFNEGIDGRVEVCIAARSNG